MHSYAFSIYNDFPNHTVAPDRLTKEILNSNIATALDCINTKADACWICFPTELIAKDVTTLNGLVAAHQGNKFPAPPETYYGTGSPESVVAGVPGDLYLNQSGGAKTTLYVKESGAGTTGWIAK